jgi:Na+-translocating ferredoxin:NAD+ oxidoreductase RnfG subunit
MKLPRIFRTTPFRLTLLFLALFASAASAFLAYIYVATAGEAKRRTDQEITREMHSSWPPTTGRASMRSTSR